AGSLRHAELGELRLPRAQHVRLHLRELADLRRLEKRALGNLDWSGQLGNDARHGTKYSIRRVPVPGVREGSGFPPTPDPHRSSGCSRTRRVALVRLQPDAKIWLEVQLTAELQDPRIDDRRRLQPARTVSELQRLNRRGVQRVVGIDVRLQPDLVRQVEDL